MALSENETWLLRHLDAQKPTKSARGLPNRAGAAQDEIEQAVQGLLDRGYVWVEGPPNQNSVVGKDYDLIALLPLGERAAQSLTVNRRS